MLFCHSCLRLFRLLFSLRGGLLGLCCIYATYMLLALVANFPPLLLRTFESLLSKSLISMGTAYHAFGIIVTILALVGSLFNEKNFIIPLLVYDSILFVSFILTFCYLLQSKNEFLEKDMNLVYYLFHIGFCYFAIILEYNFYRDLVRKTKPRPQGIPESLIILPSETSGPINPVAVLQQYKTSSDSSDNSSYHYVYGVSEAMVRLMQTFNSGAHSSGSSSNNAVSPVLYNAESESVFEIPPPPYKP